jgi:Type 9 secretion system plug protein 1st domain
MNRIFLILLILNSLSGLAQQKGTKNFDNIYVENIHSVRFQLDGVLLSYPIIDLNSSAQLLLSFDDFNENFTTYFYTLTLCNADWKPAELDELDYLDGYNREIITDYEFSFNTLKNYTHYELKLPNDDIRWLVSGNYLLNVYEEKDEEEVLVITRRFMVVEPILKTTPQMVFPSIVSKFKTHQEIDFTVNHKGVEIDNPRKEISAVVLQNGRWDNAISDLKPVYIKGFDLIFDFQDKVVFPAGKEFRYLDIRTFRYVNEKIVNIYRSGEYYDVMLFKEGPRIYRNFQTYNDINGDFLIDHLEERNPDLEGEYASVFFSLGVSQEYFDSDIYIFGKITDWQLKEEFKMAYNPTVSAYVGRALLKQGFYNYYYVEVPAESTTFSHETIEGNWHETENKYTVLVYYRPFGARHDRLVSAFTISSSDN